MLVVVCIRFLQKFLIIEAGHLRCAGLLAAAKTRADKTMGLRLAHELLDALEGRGAAVKKKMDVHKMAEANRAFSHYAW